MNNPFMTVLVSVSLISTAGLFGNDGTATGTVRPTKATDEFDTLYTLRINLIKKTINIYDSVVDEATAKTAAQDLVKLAPDQKTVNELQLKLGNPSVERQGSLNKVYGSEMGELSVKITQSMYKIAAEPYGKILQMAQMQMLADAGNEEFKEQLRVMRNPEEMKKINAEIERKNAEIAKLKVHPDLEKAGEKWLGTIKTLNTLLKPVTDTATAKKTLPKIKPIVAQLEIEQAELHKLTRTHNDSNWFIKNKPRMSEHLVPALMKCSQLAMSKDKEVQAVMLRILQQFND